MKVYTIRSEALQWVLNRDGKPVGYYVTLQGLLRGAREILLRDKTKSGAELASLCESVERKDAVILEELRKIAIERTSN